MRACVHACESAERERRRGSVGVRAKGERIRQTKRQRNHRIVATYALGIVENVSPNGGPVQTDDCGRYLRVAKLHACAGLSMAMVLELKQMLEMMGGSMDDAEV